MKMDELAKAFEGESKADVKAATREAEEKATKADAKVTKADAKVSEPKKKRALPIVTFLAGLAILIAGVVFLVIKLAERNAVSDAERLVELGTFIKDGEEGVVWQFTEIGKGTLTTNNHLNDYDFIWAIENGKLKIETAWLYDLNDEFSYKIDGDKLILDGEIILKTQ